MLFIHVEAFDQRNADLRRAAERDRRHRAPLAAHPGPGPKPPRRRTRRSIRSTAAAAVTRVAR